MITGTKTELCRRCGRPLIYNNGEPPFCLVHGEQSPEPISEEIKPRVKTAVEESSKKPGMTVKSEFEKEIKQMESETTLGPHEPPPLPTIKNRFTMHAYYKANKEQIIFDCKLLGTVKTSKKWKIASSTLFHLKKKWSGENTGGSPKQLKAKHSAEQPSPAIPDRHHLPALPDYDHAWPVELQLKWLNIYEKLINV